MQRGLERPGSGPAFRAGTLVRSTDPEPDNRSVRRLTLRREKHDTEGPDQADAVLLGVQPHLDGGALAPRDVGVDLDQGPEGALLQRPEPDRRTLSFQTTCASMDSLTAMSAHVP